MTYTGALYERETLRLALVAAADGTIGTPLDQLILYCFHYDPQTGRYSG